MAIILMLSITALIRFTLYKSIGADFDLKMAIFRLKFSLILSVPTAYFAREASKHRQQHLYLQTYLDLVAIDPCVEKMGDRDKYRIKALVANRIFSKANITGNNSDSYPINVQQLIETMDTKSNKEKSE